MYSIEYIYKTFNFYYNDKLSFNKISKKLKISRQIVSIWIKKFKENINFLFKRKNECSINKKQKIFHIDVINFINNVVYKNPFIKKNEIIDIVKNTFNIKLTLNNITKIYKQLNLTRKKPKYHVIKNINYLEQLIEKRKVFFNEINNYDINKIISIDESCFDKLFNTTKGLSKKGDHINIPSKLKNNKKTSLLMAISTNGIINNILKNDNINGLIFFDFIKNIIDNLNGSNYIFLFDNVNFHHNKKTLELIISTGNKYIFTPPYSPNNNPIENVFSILKNKYHKIKNYNKIENIKKVINDFNYEYNKNKIINIFKHAFSFNYNSIINELKDRIIFIT
jgi:transposase/predicted DNA-binding protein YlxM (UPF0122 family)